MELNRAVAVAHVHGPQAGLDVIEIIARTERFDSHYLLHAVSGELYSRLHNHPAAAGSYRRALELAQVGPEQAHLARELERAEKLAGYQPEVSQVVR